jgi:hypothetical protein
MAVQRWSKAENLKARSGVLEAGIAVMFVLVMTIQQEHT